MSLSASDPALPELSVVVVAASGMATIGQTLGCLRAQTAAQRTEVLIVAPTDGEIDPGALGAERFAALRTVAVGPISRRGDAAAAGIGAASAPVVALLEDHSYPEPGWAAALISAHDGPWAGVGPRVENANPGTAVSRVTFWLTYASMTGPQSAGVRTLLPWHNSAYKRELLAGYGERLGPLLEWEGNLQADLIARGLQLYMEPAARTHHVQVSAPRAALAQHFQRGRILGGQRAAAERWPWWHRAAYAAAMPLLPAMALRYIAADLRRAGVTARGLAADGLALAVSLTALALGEAVGTLTGPGDAIDRLEDYELNRYTHLSGRREHRPEGTQRAP
ncbi:MAG TPA: hypothetical protein VG223_06640 [Solirubrobacteraceae bacterium]|nr:hypothetical protein [Solirubrobacteraceae bacterium]